jgi:ABC-type transport system substrate-binding protein
VAEIYFYFFYCLLDGKQFTGYDAVWFYETVIEKHKATPLIAFNPKGAFAAPEGFDDTLHPVCSGGYKLTYWGKDGDYLKFRCPHATAMWTAHMEWHGVQIQTMAIV